MTEKDFIPEPYKSSINNGSYTWSAPSNIALVKYWGKKENQIPANPSISFTLNDCLTTTTLQFHKKEVRNHFDFDVFFEGEKMDDFKPKIATFFDRIHDYLPFLKEYRFHIETSNTFPHSSGIASSASGMSALALCLMSIEKALIPNMNDDYFLRKASFLARLGSGSASRSIKGDLVIWGSHESIENTSDLYGIQYPFKVHENFKDFQDTILLVDKGEKKISSSIGHNLMYNHPFAQKRFQQAHENILKLKEVFALGDLKGFIKIVESEALTLHAMMLTSDPYFILMKPNTLEIINKIWDFRNKTDLNICFTLDAGANVHVLYPKAETNEVYEFIQRELVAYCQNGHYICDRIGVGAKQQLLKIK